MLLLLQLLTCTYVQIFYWFKKKKINLKLCNVYSIPSDSILYVCKSYRFGDPGVQKIWWCPDGIIRFCGHRYVIFSVVKGIFTNHLLRKKERFLLQNRPLKINPLHHTQSKVMNKNYRKKIPRICNLYSVKTALVFIHRISFYMSVHVSCPQQRPYIS